MKITNTLTITKHYNDNDDDNDNYKGNENYKDDENYNGNGNENYNTYFRCGRDPYAVIEVRNYTFVLFSISAIALTLTHSMFRWGIVDDKPKLWKAQFIRDLRGRSYCEPPFHFHLRLLVAFFSLSLSSQIIVSLFFHFHFHLRLL